MSDDDGATWEAFGYREQDGIVEPVSWQVAEGKNPETLQPLVMLFFRLDADQPQHGLALTPEFAEHVADELRTWAARAREKHWEP